MPIPRKRRQARKATRLVTVKVTLPKEFVRANQRRCQGSNITLSEAIRFVAETLLPQQFKDECLELDLLRHVMGTRSPASNL